jgi:hypothetical protein
MKLGLLAAAAAALGQGEPQPQDRARTQAPTGGVAAAESDAGVIAYPAAFFAEARPITAFDMLQRLPGFTFNPGQQDVRGFGAAGGNVLIDGERPSSKSVDLEATLRRIPAATVTRVELIRGAVPGIDMQGQPLVANVIRSGVAATTLTGTAGAAYGYFDGGRVYPRLDLEWSRQAQGLNLDGAIRAYTEADDDGGDGFRTRRTADGALIEAGPYAARVRDRWLQADGSAALQRGRDSIRVNLGGELHQERTEENVRRSDAQGRALGPQNSVRLFDEKAAELGGDYERAFSDKVSGRLVFLATRAERTEEENALTLERTAVGEAGAKVAETVVRGVLTVGRSPTLSFEGGAEGALNVLDATNRLVIDGAPITLPSANVRVEEKRGEGFLTAFWTPWPALKLEGGARAEVSRISQSGDSSLSRSFFFPKPRLRATYAPDPDTQVRLRVEREVGQLDFADFAASAELEANVVSAGGADLQPERAWVFEAAFERRFWDGAAVVLTLRHAQLQQVVDRIPLPGGFDAPGNIGDGVRNVVEVVATLPLDRLGLKGGLITSRTTWTWSKVSDPVTGERRIISEDNPFTGDVRFSHDVRALRSTWGVEGALAQHFTLFRIDEVRRQSRETQWMVYWDWKPSPALSVRAEVRNATRRDRERVRWLYAGPRSLGAVQQIEHRTYETAPYVYLRVRRTL